MMVVRRAWCALVVALASVACGESSDDDESNSSGDSGASGGAQAGGSSSAGKSGVGGSSTGGEPSTGGSTTGGNPGAGGSGSNGGSSGGGSGGSDAGGTASIGPGTVTEEWTDFCVATFTEDYEVTDDFGEPLFTVRTGEEYLLIAYPEPYSRAQAAYLTPTGHLEFDIEPSDDFTSFPFTSNCSVNPPLSYFAVFADVSVYAEPELTTKLCNLASGAALPRLSESSAGYALEALQDGGAVYEVFLNAFSSECGGAESGYVIVPSVHLFDSDRVLVPFDVIVADD
jgi:hypothetical protein